MQEIMKFYSLKKSPFWILIAGFIGSIGLLFITQNAYPDGNAPVLAIIGTLLPITSSAITIVFGFLEKEITKSHEHHGVNE